MADRHPTRRDVLTWAGALAAAGLGGALVGDGALAAPAAGAAAGAGDLAAFDPVRPPAAPLAVRSMYLTTWLAGDTLPGRWPSFWTGRTTAICGIATVDGTSYLFAGDPTSPSLTPMEQTAVTVTATRTVYRLRGGGVALTVTFLSPVDLADLRRQSVPMSYVTVEAASDDGAAHRVAVYLDISAEWAHGDDTAHVSWQHRTTGTTEALTVTPADPSELAEHGEMASWGTVVFAADTGAGLTWQIGQDTAVRAAGAAGALAGTADTDQPRAINDRWPVLALRRDLGTVGDPASFTVYIGHVRRPAVTYLGTRLDPWWTSYWADWPAMLDAFAADHAAAAGAATALDTRVHDDAVAAAGERYAALCALAVRQAVAGTELVDRGGAPWAFLKEISSNGDMSTVDVIYPAFPAYLYLSPAYLRLVLEPVLDYAERGGWPKEFAEHDLGVYPNAPGHNDGNEEDMPVEESANMLIMSALVARHLDAAEADAFLSAHYPMLRRWAEYLVGTALDPGYQNQTDDFTGFIAHSVNLALKGIVGLGAMSVLAAAAGNTADHDRYLSIARSYISQWYDMALDPSGDHLKLAYDQDGTWSLKYNGFPDRLLGLDLVPAAVADSEAAWYLAGSGRYGVLLDPRNDYTKADWEVWTAGWLADHTAARDALVTGVYNYVNESPSRVPFSDWYVVASATQQGFTDRPVVGGMLSMLPTRVDRTTWYRIRNRHSAKVLAVLGASTANSAEIVQYTDNGTSDHLWALVPEGSGTVRIVNRRSGKVLAVHNQSMDDEAHVQQYVDNGTPDHVWRLDDAGDGWVKIVNVRSGKVLAVDGMSTQDNAQVTQYADNGTEDHLWQLVD